MNNEIMTRMKDNYESRSRTYLTRRTPVIIRLDGKAFHTYTKGLIKPFDEGLIEDMQTTAKYLCENIQGVKCAYVQSDEISLLLTDYDNLETQAWFDYEVQKMISISASLAATKFNQLRQTRFLTMDFSVFFKANTEEVFEIIADKFSEVPNLNLANFDSRCFNIPKEEVSNYFLARLLDAETNSVSMLAQSLYSQKELNGKGIVKMIEMCKSKGILWEDLNWTKKKGSFIVKNIYCNEILVSSHFNYGRILYYNNKYYDRDEFTDIVAYLPSQKGIENPSIKHRWDTIEPPKFNQLIFEQWL